MYAINANHVRWTEFTNWLNERGLVQGQDYELKESIPGWTLIDFQRENDFWEFSLYAGTLTY